MTSSAPFVVTHMSEAPNVRDQMVADIRTGLTSAPPWLHCKYLYDGRGSELFEEITKQPEYYPTRAEAEILETRADEIMEIARPDELLEIGSGSSRKTRALLEAMQRHGGTRYVPLDVSEDAVEAAARALVDAYPWLEVTGLVGDFAQHLDEIPRRGRRLVAFLGSTIGNLSHDEQIPFLRSVRKTLAPGDAFLLGVDLIKDPAVLEAAYNDRAGVTEQFTKNIVVVLNRELSGDLPVDAFEHVARWNPERAAMDIRLRCKRAVDARLEHADLDLHWDKGDDISVEISCKFTRELVAEMFVGADMAMEAWMTDSKGRFALALARPV